MAPADQLFNQFVEAWNTGQRPDVDDYAAQAPEAERAEFLSLVSLFLEQAPAPQLDDEALAAVRAEPAFKQAAALAGSERGLWSELLPRLRDRIEMTRDQLVAQLAGQLGVPAEQERVGVYYHQMETGQLDPAGVSRRVLDALAKLLPTNVPELEQAAEFRGITEDRAVFLRSAETSDQSLKGLVRDSAQNSSTDEVDRLFTGGR